MEAKKIVSNNLFFKIRELHQLITNILNSFNKLKKPFVYFNKILQK